MFKAAVLTASIVGIISTFADFAAPSEGMKKQLKMIITLVLILALFTPFIGSDFKIAFDSIGDLSEDNSYSQINRDFSDYYLNQANSNVEKTLLSRLAEEEIYPKGIRIYSELNEYNSIEITKAEVYADNLDDSSKDRLINIISAVLPDADIFFDPEVESETQ